jgi:Na+-driven multidrug efflux pump
VRPKALFAKSREITVTGFSTFFIDIAMGILTMLFNRQIMRYAGTDALAVYGIIVNVSTIVQCCGYSVGQAAQPLLSINFGANNGDRIKQTLKYALQATAFFSIVWTALTLLLPKAFVYIFMAPTPGVLAITPRIMRSYGISFLLLPLNVFSTYYFQSLIRPGASMLVSMLRGMIISGGLIYLLPAVAGADALWFTMPITELIVAVLVVWLMREYTKQLPGQSKSAMA